ncbi:MAG: S-layer protein, partial [archaeon]
GYLTLGDGTETSWQVDLANTTTNTNITVKDIQSHLTTGTSDPVLYPGDSNPSPNGLFALTYNGLTDKYGNAPDYVKVDVQPTTRDLDKSGTAQPVIRVRTPGGDYIVYSGTKLTNEIWINTTEGTDKFYYKDPTTSTLTYTASTTAAVKLTTANSAVIRYFSNVSGEAVGSLGHGYVNIAEPALFTNGGGGAGATSNITIEYNSSYSSNNGRFEDVNNTDSTSAYVYFAAFPTASATANFIAREGTTEPLTRDYITPWGTEITAGNNLVTLEMPREQLFGEIVLGTLSEGKGTPVTVAAGETTKIGGIEIEVAGSVSGKTPVTLPNTLARLDSEVTQSDKNTYTLVLVGGPAVNTLVNELQTEGKLVNTFKYFGGDATGVIDQDGEFSIELVADAFAEGKYAIVAAGYTADDSRDAGSMLAAFDANLATLDGKTAYVG